MTQQEITQLQKDAADGNVDSQYQLAMMHIYGNGVPEESVPMLGMARVWNWWGGFTIVAFMFPVTVSRQNTGCPKPCRVMILKL